MYKNERKLAREGAKWWRKQIENVTANSFNNGETSKENVIASVLALSNAKMENISKEQLQKFEEKLEEILYTELKRYGHLVVTSDYNPDMYLEKASEEAGISKSVFPWKTIMWIQPDLIETRVGYNGIINKIYSE